MKAFVEILSGIVRAGPQCDAYGKPFECSVAFSSSDGKTAVMKALTSNGALTVAHARAAFAVLAGMGLRPVWERFDQ